MENYPRQKLREIITPQSDDLVENPRRLEGLLRDYCSRYKREVNVLVSACKERVPQELLTARDFLPHEILVTRLVSRLVENLALSVDAAGWAVETWALALGVIHEPELLDKALYSTSFQPSDINSLQFNHLLTLAPGVTMRLVRIPAGEFLMGSTKLRDEYAWDDETPQHSLYLDEYLIGRTPVTVAQYAAFMMASGYKANEGCTNSMGKHPITRVSWDDAAAFCRWATQLTGRNVRLPNEAEWEKAARGIDGRIWPWGDQPPDAAYCNFDCNTMSTTAVGKYSPKGDSPYGCTDMAGNVWEWTGSILGDYPYNKDDGRQDLHSRGARILRGGSYSDVGIKTRCACRHWDLPELSSSYSGLRVVVDF
jgi:formylglycine-generating enzyme required for sulfatase activity